MARLAERLLVQAHQLTSEIDELTAELSARLQVLALTLATRSLARELTGASGPTRTTGPTAAPAAILVAASIVSRSPSSMTSPHRRASATTGTSPGTRLEFRIVRPRVERTASVRGSHPAHAHPLQLTWTWTSHTLPAARATKGGGGR